MGEEHSFGDKSIISEGEAVSVCVHVAHVHDKLIAVLCLVLQSYCSLSYIKGYICCTVDMSLHFQVL